MPASTHIRTVLAAATAIIGLQPAHAQIATYSDRTEFLTACGASTATGPLPDLGFCPVGAHIGTITFTEALGGDRLAIGGAGIAALPAGDWYEPTSGNDIALGYENLRVEMDGPVYALGFEMVEPDLTMPEWGGVPVDTDFEVVLYNGGVEVARFTFNVADDDVDAFVGVWSREPFDSATIIDLNGDDDDEYFGEFYTGATPLPDPCYANCDGSTEPPILNVNDFICFQSLFASADPAADCDHSSSLNVNDFICFQQAFAAGCP